MHVTFSRQENNFWQNYGILDLDDFQARFQQENNFWQNYGILDLDNFQVGLQYGVASLCNQLLLEFSSNQFVTFHRCNKHIEDVHLTFSRQENNFWQNYGILDLDDFQARFQ